ncbi:DUF2314 domain-containing protein [Algibacter sp. R77976]|uniref:DUF2314 domain-containing protein n=1 Tax=Algibacter sp. R77976 TaxID=3093873 RepID=UPI0037C9AEEA
MKFRFLILALLSITLSCSQNKTSKNILSDETIIVEYIIYYLDNDNVNESSAKEIFKSDYPTFKMHDTFPDPDTIRGNNVIITGVKNIKEDYPPMDLEYLNYTSQGLTDIEKNKLQSTKHALVIDISCNKDDLVSSLKSINDFVYKLIKDKEAVVYDSETRETVSKAFWQEKRLINNASVNLSNHITIHFYQKDEFCRAITLGMSKFGLPDITIENLSCKSGTELASFINLIAQSLFEKQTLNNEGLLSLNINSVKNESLKTRLLSDLYENAEKQADVKLIEGSWEEGDPENRLIEVAFSSDNPQIEHNEVLTKLFGFIDEVSMLKHDNELEEASERAKTKIPELKKQFLGGLPVNSHLLIKFPFESTDGQREWMWVEITKWKGDNIDGLLQNEPRLVLDLKAGQKVSKNINTMFDYILFKPDGSQEGNETGEIILKNQK